MQRSWKKYGVLDRVKLSFERTSLTCDEIGDDRQRFFESASPAIEWNIESVEFRFVPSGAESEDETSMTDVRDRCRHFGDDRRRVKADAGDEGPKGDAIGDGSKCREKSPCLLRSSFRAAVSSIQQMVTDPDRIELRAVSEPGHGEILRPVDDSFDLGELNTDRKSLVFVRIHDLPFGRSADPWSLRAQADLTAPAIGRVPGCVESCRGLFAVYFWVMTDPNESADIRSDPTTIDAAWMNTVLRGSEVAGSASVVGCRFDGFVGTGQTGCNARFTLTWDDPTGRPPTIMGKFPSQDPTARSTGFAGGAYVTEWNFYSRIAPTVNVRAPRCYHAALDLPSEQFCLIMEDLSGSQQGDQFIGLTLDEAELAIDQAVLLHAPRWGDPTLAESAAQVTTVEERSQRLQMIYSMLLPAFLDRLGARLDDQIRELISTFNGHVARWAEGTGTPLTVAHYDFRPDNFLFARTPEAPPLVIVDWQTANEGLGMVDVAYMIAGSFTPERRREVERSLVQSYLSKLRSAGVSYSDEDSWRDYKFGSLWGLIITVLATSMAARTERGDDLFVTMATQHGYQALDHGALDLVR